MGGEWSVAESDEQDAEAVWKGWRAWETATREKRAKRLPFRAGCGAVCLSHLRGHHSHSPAALLSLCTPSTTAPPHKCLMHAVSSHLTQNGGEGYGSGRGGGCGNGRGGGRRNLPRNAVSLFSL